MRHGIQFRHVSQGTFVRVWTKHNVLSVWPEKTAKKSETRHTPKQRVRGFFTWSQKCRIFRGNPKCPRNDHMFATCLIPKKNGSHYLPIPGLASFLHHQIWSYCERLPISSYLPTSIFQGLLLLVLGSGTHLLLYLLGAKFSDLTCHPASIPRAGPFFQPPPLVPKKTSRPNIQLIFK